MAFSHHEGVAAEHDAYVVVPPAKASTLEVVETELALQVLVRALGAPALSGDAHERVERRVGRQRREVVEAISELAA